MIDTTNITLISFMDTLTNISYPILPMIDRTETIASSSWFGVLLVFILVALAISLSIHRKQYILLVRNVVNKQGRVMSYENEQTEIWANILLWIIIILSYSLSAFSLSQIIIGKMLPSWIFLCINILVSSVLLFKWIIFKLIGYIFSIEEKVKSFVTDYFVIIALYGLLLIPCAIGLVYSTEMMQSVYVFIVLALSVFVFVIVTVKLVQIFYSGTISLFYIFLYLCSLEILPISIMLKFASVLINKV